MGTELDGDGERAVVRCTECGTEAAALVDDSDTVVTVHEECRECGGETFEEVAGDDIDDVPEAEDWAN